MSSPEADAENPRRIIGNLDCETEFAVEAHSVPSPRRTLPRRVLSAIAEAATLLRVFAQPGDRLWLPAQVDPRRMADVPSLPRPPLENGSVGALSRTRRTLAWGETAGIAKARAQPLEDSTRWTDREIANLPVDEAIWHLPTSSVAAAAAVNDRAFCRQLTAALGCRLPGSRCLTSAKDLATHLAEGGARDATRGGWVLKARFSAAGRWRYIHRAGRDIDHRRVERLLASHGSVVFEPWMERVADFGYAAAVTSCGLRRFGIHRLQVDPSGRFLGVEVSVGDDPGAAWLDDDERSAFENALKGAAEALSRAGYRGPFGIDGWRYRNRDGALAFHPLGEINGRLTFGLVARALVDRLSEPLELSPGTRVRLCFGKPAADDEKGAHVPLLHAARPSGRAIWLEIGSP